MSDEPKEIVSGGERFELHEFRVEAGGRELKVLHGGVILSHADEAVYLGGRHKQVPYGLSLWPAGIALSYALAEMGGTLKGKRVLELGAGVGLPGVVAGAIGANVLQTDREAVALQLCAANARRNGVVTETRVADWTDWKVEEKFDLVVGSDVLYGEVLHPHLLRIFEQNLAPGGRVIISDPLRGPSVRLMEKMENQGWRVSGSKWELGDEVGGRVVGVFELARSVL